MSDIFQKHHNIKFGIEIEMISPLQRDEFVKVFNTTAQQFLLPIKVDIEDRAPENFWKIKSDSSITFLSKNIDKEVYPTQIAKEKFPSHKIISQASGVGYRTGEQIFLPVQMAEPQPVSEAKLLDRKPKFQVGDEEIQFRKSSSGTQIEMISPPLSFDTMHIDQVRWVINILRRMRMKVNASTGIHVHVSFNELDLFNFTKLLKNVDEKKIKELWPTRFNTTYTKKKDDVINVVKKYIGDLFNKYMRSEKNDYRISNANINDILAVANNMWERYYGINIKAFTSHGTVEFRYAGSELREKRVIGWLEYIKELVVKSLTQDSVRIGEYEITSKDGLLSITSDYHPNEVLTSNSIIDQFLMRNNRAKGVTLFLKEKGILDDKEKIMDEINEYPYRIQVKPKQINTKIVALEGFLLFLKELVKEKVITAPELALHMSDNFNDALQAYIAKELINNGIAKFTDFVDEGDNSRRITSRIRNILDALNNKQLNQIPLDYLRLAFINLLNGEEDKSAINFLKKLDSEKALSMLKAEVGTKFGMNLVHMIINTVRSIDDMENIFGIKLSDDTILHIFDKATIQKIFDHSSDTSKLLEFLFRSFSPLAKKVLGESFQFDRERYKFALHSVLSAFNAIFNDSDTVNKENVHFFIDKFKTSQPEGRPTTRDIELLNKIKFNEGLFNGSLTYDEVIDKISSGDEIDDDQAKFIVKTKNKLGIFAMTISLFSKSNLSDDVKTLLKNDEKLKDEVFELLKRYIKTNENLGGSQILYLLNMDINDYGFDKLLKQEFFNRIGLSREELSDFLNNVAYQSEVTFENSKYKEIINLLLGVEKNKKFFIKICQGIEFTELFSNDKFTEYAKQKLAEFKDEINYETLTKKIYNAAFSGSYSHNKKTETNFFKFLNDPNSIPYLDVTKIKEGVKKQVHENFTDFVDYLIENISDEKFKESVKKIIDTFEIQNPGIEYLSKPDDENLKNLLTSINDGNKMSDTILERIIRNMGDYYDLGGSPFNSMKSKTLALRLLSYAHNNSNIRQSIMPIWLSKYYFQANNKMPDADFLEGLHNIGPNLVNVLLTGLNSEVEDYYLQKYIANNYYEFKKLPFFDKISGAFNDIMATQEKMVKSNFNDVKWKNTWTPDADHPERSGIRNTVVRFNITGKGNLSLIMNSIQHDFYSYSNTSTFMGKDFHEEDKQQKNQYTITYRNIDAIIQGFEDKNPDILSTSQWKLITSMTRLILRNLESQVGFKENTSDTIHFTPDNQLELFPEEEKKEEKSEEVKEEINYSKKFKELMLTEGVNKARSFLMKNKDKINDRKLVSVIKRMGI